MTREEAIDELYKQGRAAQKEDRSAASAELLGAYLRHRPAHGSAWYQYGRSLLAMGLFNEAEQALHRASELEPDHYEIFMQLGLVYHEMGQLDKAEQHYAMACSFPDGERNGSLWIMRGGNLAVAGEHKKAEECHRRGFADAKAAHDEAYLNIGLLCRAQGRYREAAAALEEALRITPAYPEAREALQSLAGLNDALAQIEHVEKHSGRTEDDDSAA